MAVPNIFATKTGSIPLSELDANFATPITVGTTSIALGDTAASISNVSLVNPTLGTPASGTLTNCTIPQLSSYATTSSLAASTGSTLVGTIQSGTGATARTVASKLNDIVSVKDFGAVGDGVADDTLAIQAAINYAQSLITTSAAFQSTGAGVYFPTGKYLISSALTITKSGIGLFGDAGLGAMITGDCNFFTVGDYTKTFRVRSVEITNLILRQTNYANSSAAITLYRTASFTLSNITIVNFYIGVDCYRASASLIQGINSTVPNRTTNALAVIRMQGTDDSLATGETYGPGGGMHVTDCEFTGYIGTGSSQIYTESAFKILAVDGLYVVQCHWVGMQYGFNVCPDASAANHNTIDINVENVYFDEPATPPATVADVILQGSVNTGIVLANGSLVNSTYQGFRFTNCYFRGANLTSNCVVAKVTDAGAFASGGKNIKGLSFTGGEIVQAGACGVVIQGYTSGYLEFQNVTFSGVQFRDNNYNNSQSASACDIIAETENIAISGCIFAASVYPSLYCVAIANSPLPSNSPSAVITGNDFSNAISTGTSPVLASLTNEAIYTIANNNYPLAGSYMSQVYKTITSDASPAILWQANIYSTGQAIVVNTKCVSGTTTGTETSIYEQRCALTRVASGTTVQTGLTTLYGIDNVTGNNAPAVLGVLTGTAWASTTPVTAGTYITNAGNCYLVMISGTTSSTAPTFTSGTATNGTATLGYVATTAPNIVALVVSGTAATDINWVAKIEMITT